MRVLLDTSFLLPVVGVRVREVVDGALYRLWQLHKSGEVELFYTDFNIIEIVWKLSKLECDPLIVEKGLRSIERSMSKAQPRLGSILKALELRKKGFRDVIDLLLYLTAKDNGLLFLTYDVELVRFLKDVGEDVSNIAENLERLGP